MNGAQQDKATPIAYSIAGAVISSNPPIAVVAEEVSSEVERIWPRSTSSAVDDIATREFLSSKGKKQILLKI